VHQITAARTDKVLGEWIQRTQFYQSDPTDPMAAVRRMGEVERMEAMRVFARSSLKPGTGSGKDPSMYGGLQNWWLGHSWLGDDCLRTLLGLEGPDGSLYAIAAAEMSAGEVEVTQLIVSPSVLEKKSKVAEQLLVGMETFAADMDMILNSRQVYDTIAQRVFLEMAEERAKAQESGAEYDGRFRLDAADDPEADLPQRPEPPGFSSWTRVTSLARARDAAIRSEDFRAAADLKAAMKDLDLMDEGDLEQKAQRVEELVAAEDYAGAAALQAELDALAQRWRA
jgi:hypothetical protein